MRARRQSPCQIHSPPIETMAAALAASGRDLADDAICIQVLIGSSFSCADILAGLDQAQNRARELIVEAA